MFRNWVRRLFPTRRQFPIVTKPTRQVKRNTRLFLEPLEDRLAPATLIVTDPGDAGANTLRGRIAAATNGNDTIVFDPSLAAQTINLTTFTNTNSDFGAEAFHLTGSENLTIQGSGETINGNNSFRFIQVDPNATLNLDSITVQNFEAQGGNGGTGGGGGAAGMGGAIFNQGTLNITNSTFTLNTAQGGAGAATLDFFGSGGGVGQNGSTQGGSAANGGGPNGGVGSGGSGGFGGGGASGISISTGGNGGFGGGGGSGFIIGGNGGFGGGGGGIDGLAVSGGAGGFGGGSGDLRNGNSGNGGGGAGIGGAIFNVGFQNGGGPANVSITNSTFVNNSAIGGAAGGGTATGGAGYGGVVFNVDGQVSVMNDTFAFNTVTGGANGGGGNAAFDGRTLYNRQQTTTTAASVTNSIMNESTAPGSSFEIVNDGATITGGHNILSSVSGGRFNNINGGNQAGFTVDAAADPMFAHTVLTDNGGPTKTLDLQSGSPAFNAGTTTGAPSTDQRGGQRNGVNAGGANPDIGAYQHTNSFLVTINNDLPTPASPPVVSPALNYGTGSLRTAITWANINVNPTSTASGNVINFASGVTSVGINSALPSFNSAHSLPITVNGAGVTVTGTGSGPNQFGIFSINTGTTVTMNGAVGNVFTITGGNDPANFGGGINNAGTLTINNMTITGNAATTGGGGIYNSGTLHIDDTVAGTTTISNNSAGEGGGLMNDVGGTATLGGAGGTTTVIISGNTATTTSTLIGAFHVGGGGILNEGTLTLTNSTVNGNSANAGRGIQNISNGSPASLTVTGSTISNNFGISGATANLGGGIENAAASGAATLTATNTTISGNAGGGGGIGQSGASAQTTLTNVTISGNTVSGFGGGAAGLDNQLGGTAALLNTIVAGNTGLDVAGTITSQGHNLIGSGVWTAASGDMFGVTNPLLAPLGNYSAAGQNPTQTIALLPGSKAINTGSNTSVGSNIVPATDQRGVARPQQAIYDIGAFESLGFTATITSGDPQSTPVNTAFANPLVVSVTSSDPNDPVVNGGEVLFTAPSSGPSAILTGTPGSSVPGPAPFVTGTIGAVTSGKAQVTATANAIPTPAGTPYDVAPTAAGISSVTGGTTFPSGFALQNLAPTTLTFTVQPAGASEGATFSVQVKVQDQNGAVMAGVPVTLTLSTGPGTLTGGGPVTTNSSGIAIFSSLSINEEGTGYQLIATAGTSPNTQTSNTFTISEVPVVIAPVAPLSAITEGGMFSGTVATFTDPANSTNFEAASDYSATIFWGDGTNSAGFISFSAGTFPISGSHTYAEESPAGSPYQISVTVVHTTTTTGPTVTSSITVNEALITSLTGMGGTQSVIEGGTSTVFTVATFTDPAGAEPNSSDPGGTPNTHYTTLIHWGDGSTSAGNVVHTTGNNFRIDAPPHSYGPAVEEGASFTVTVDVTHETAPTQTVTGPAVNVIDAPLSDTTAHSSTAVVEGNSTGTVIVGQITDSNPVASASDFPSDITHLLIHWGDSTTSVGTIQQVGSSNVFNILGDHVYADPNTPPGTPYNVTVDVTDVGGATKTTGLTAAHLTQFVVSDGVLADATLPATFNAFEGNSTGSQLVATFTDTNPNATAADFTAGGGSTLISWGDFVTTSTISVVKDLANSNATFSTWKVFGTHTYLETATYNVTVTITDDDGGTVTTADNNVTFNVLDASLVDTTMGQTLPAVEGNPTGPQIVAKFADNNPFAPPSGADFPSAGIIINWGDSTTSQGTAVFLSTNGIQSFWKVVGSHTYAELGTFTVSVTIADEDGSSLLTPATASQAVSFNVTDGILTDVTTMTTITATEGISTASGPPFTIDSLGNQVVAVFQDSNPNAPITDFGSPTITWGDFSSSTGTVQLVSRSLSVSTWEVLGSHTYAEPQMFGYQINVFIQDVDGSTLNTPQLPGNQVTVNVVDAPLMDATPNQVLSSVEGSSTGQIVVATFNDLNPNAPINDFIPPNGSAMIDWGDFTPPTAGTVQFVSSGPTFSTWQVLGMHTYTEAGPVNIHVLVTDVDSRILITGGLNHTVTMQVADAPLTDIANATTNQVCAGMAATSVTVATFSDANPFATNADFNVAPGHVAIDWGDGSGLDTTSGFVTPGVMFLNSVTFNVQGTHTYLRSGVFNVSVLIVDDDGAMLQTPSSGSNLITFNVGPNNMVFTTMPSSVVSGKPFTVVVTGFDDALDTQVSTGYNGPITLSIKPGTGPTGGHLGGTVMVNAIAGVATFTNLTLDRATTPPPPSPSFQYDLRATSNCGLTDSSPRGIQVTASNIIVTSIAMPKPNIYFPVNFRAVDITGNTATNYVGPITFTITQTPLHGLLSVLSGPQNVPIGGSLGTYPFVLGLFTLNLKCNSPGTFTVAWSTPDGFFGSFSWNYGRRISISSTGFHVH
jgi:hypothetical protein